MNSIDLKVKKLNENAVLPAYAHDTDAGMDLVATSKTVEDGLIVYGTGIALEVPEGYVGLIFQRSSICNKNLNLTNAVGVIDSGYRGEIKFKFAQDTRALAENLSNVLTGSAPTLQKEYEIGDKIGQLIVLPFPKVKIVVTDYLSPSSRNEQGFGSTGA